MSDVFYLDYNATSPFVSEVQDFLSKGDFLYANPASSHRLGKQARREVSSCSQKIKSLFELPDHEIVYHSGATEWLNTVYNLGPNDALFYFAIDHSATRACADALAKKGVKVIALPVTGDGEFDDSQVISIINQEKTSGINWLNYTVLHNETGVHWPLAKAVKIKAATEVFVQVDAVQLVGKLPDWQCLDARLDAYVFSSHKFGAMKSFGFSLIDPNLPISSFVKGGAQQSLRSGTENPLAVTTTKLALGANLDRLKLNAAMKFKQRIEDLCNENPKLRIIGKALPRAVNTIGFVHQEKSSNEMLMHFDLEGLMVGTGAACGSGIQKELNLLMELGQSAVAKNFIRLSFSPFLDFDQDLLEAKLKKVLQKL